MVDYIGIKKQMNLALAHYSKGDAPDIARMNAKVRKMMTDALASDGVEEIFKMGQGDTSEVDIFDPDYMEKTGKIKLPNTN